MRNLIPDESLFCLEAIEFQCNFVLRPSKVRKLVCTNQFQVKSTKMGTGRKFVTLQYLKKKKKKKEVTDSSPDMRASLLSFNVLYVLPTVYHSTNFLNLHLTDTDTKHPFYMLFSFDSRRYASYFFHCIVTKCLHLVSCIQAQYLSPKGWRAMSSSLALATITYPCIAPPRVNAARLRNSRSVSFSPRTSNTKPPMAFRSRALSIWWT